MKNKKGKNDIINILIESAALSIGFLFFVYIIFTEAYNPLIKMLESIKAGESVIGDFLIALPIFFVVVFAIKLGQYTIMKNSKK